MTRFFVDLRVIDHYVTKLMEKTFKTQICVIF